MKKFFLLSTIALFFAASTFASPMQAHKHKHHKHHKHMSKHHKDDKMNKHKGDDMKKNTDVTKKK